MTPRTMLRNLSIKKKLTVGFGAIVAILLLLLTLAYNNFARLSQATRGTAIPSKCCWKRTTSPPRCCRSRARPAATC